MLKHSTYRGLDTYKVSIHTLGGFLEPHLAPAQVHRMAHRQASAVVERCKRKALLEAAKGRAERVQAQCAEGCRESGGSREVDHQ